MTPHKLWRDVGMHGVLHERCMERRGASVKIYIHYAWFIWAIQTGIWNLKHKWHCRKYTSNIYFIESMSLQFGDWKVIISLRSQNTNCRRRFLQNHGYDETLHFCEHVWLPKTHLELFCLLVKNAQFCCRPVMSRLPFKDIFTVTENTSPNCPAVSLKTSRGITKEW